MVLLWNLILNLWFWFVIVTLLLVLKMDNNVKNLITCYLSVLWMSWCRLHTEPGGAREGGGAEGASRRVRLWRWERRWGDAGDPRSGQADPWEEASPGTGVQREGRARPPHTQDCHQGETSWTDVIGSFQTLLPCQLKSGQISNHSNIFKYFFFFLDCVMSAVPFSTFILNIRWGEKTSEFQHTFVGTLISALDDFCPDLIDVYMNEAW